MAQGLGMKLLEVADGVAIRHATIKRHVRTAPGARHRVPLLFDESESMIRSPANTPPPCDMRVWVIEREQPAHHACDFPVADRSTASARDVEEAAATHIIPEASEVAILRIAVDIDEEREDILRDFCPREGSVPVL